MTRKPCEHHISQTNEGNDPKNRRGGISSKSGSKNEGPIIAVYGEKFIWDVLVDPFAVSNAVSSLSAACFVTTIFTEAGHYRMRA